MEIGVRNHHIRAEDGMFPDLHGLGGTNACSADADVFSDPQDGTRSHHLDRGALPADHWIGGNTRVDLHPFADIKDGTAHAADQRSSVHDDGRMHCGPPHPCIHPVQRTLPGEG